MVGNIVFTFDWRLFMNKYFLISVVLYYGMIVMFHKYNWKMQENNWPDAQKVDPENIGYATFIIAALLPIFRWILFFAGCYASIKKNPK